MAKDTKAPPLVQKYQSQDMGEYEEFDPSDPPLRVARRTLAPMKGTSTGYTKKKVKKKVKNKKTGKMETKTVTIKVPLEDDPGFVGMPGRQEDPKNLSTLSKVKGKLYKLYASDKAAFVALQQRLYKGGFYGDLSADEINFGTLNRDTEFAFEVALTRAAAFHDADPEGNNKTYDDVIDDAIKDHDALGGIDALLGKKGKGSITQVTDPADLKVLLQNQSKELLGDQRIDDATLSDYVARVQGNQRNAGAEGAGVQAQDPSTIAQGLLQEKFGAQIGARNVMNTGNDFFALLDGVI